MQNNNYELIEELDKKNEGHKKYIKIVSTTNVALSVIIIVILLTKTFCGC